MMVAVVLMWIEGSASTVSLPSLFWEFAGIHRMLTQGFHKNCVREGQRVFGLLVFVWEHLTCVQPSGYGHEQHMLGPALDVAEIAW
jgi:hypothetical protein